MENMLAFMPNFPQYLMEQMTLTPDHIGNFVAMVLCFTFGFLLYVYAIICMIRERSVKADPYPLFLHCWMITFDMLGTVQFTALFMQYHHWVFFLFMGCLPIWVVLEIVCIYRAVKYNRQDAFGDIFKDEEVPASKAWFYTIAMIVLSMAVNLWVCTLLGGIENCSYFFIIPFSNYVFALWTWRYWDRQAVKFGNRSNNAMGLQLIIVIQITLMWCPYLSWYTAVVPAFNTPYYYICGILCSAVAVYNFYKCAKLPKKPTLPDGKKPIW